VGRLDARLELRVDSQTLRRLEQRAAARHTSVAALVRESIARLLVEDEVGWRLAAVARGAALETPVPDDPAELARLLDQTYETG
jgi:plasmid stability protein